MLAHTLIYNRYMNTYQQNDDNDLPPEVKRIVFDRETEPPYSGEYLENDKSGIYRCVVCGAMLFSTKDQYKSRSGWPSFSGLVDADSVKLSEDLSHNMVRTEVSCAKCGAHLGHLFDDGPASADGTHYCVNSLSLKFDPGESVND